MVKLYIHSSYPANSVLTLSSNYSHLR